MFLFARPSLPSCEIADQEDDLYYMNNQAR